jgi:uncharacterized protein
MMQSSSRSIIFTLVIYIFPYYPGNNKLSTTWIFIVTDPLSTPCTAFEGFRLLASGPLIEVALAVRNAIDRSSTETILAFDDLTGAVVDFDLRGTKADLIARLSKPSPTRSAQAPSDGPVPQHRNPGRPKLGVIAREVTLLPRHWEWLSAQPGGASATLRRLVDEARRDGGALAQRRAVQAAAYRFMVAIAGDLPGFEEASRVLFAGDGDTLALHVRDWPPDIRDHLLRMAKRVGASPANSAHEQVPRGTVLKTRLAEFLRQVWSEGDIEASDEYLAPIYTIYHDPGDPWDGQTLDLNAYKNRASVSRAAFPDQHFNVQAMATEGNDVIVTWLWSATHLGDCAGFPATGKTVRMSGATTYRFDDGDRILGHWQITDRLGVYRQLQQQKA